MADRANVVREIYPTKLEEAMSMAQAMHEEGELDIEELMSATKLSAKAENVARIFCILKSSLRARYLREMIEDI